MEALFKSLAVVALEVEEEAALLINIGVGVRQTRIMQIFFIQEEGLLWASQRANQLRYLKFLEMVQK